MSKFIIFVVTVLYYTSGSLTNCATFENVNGVLTEDVWAEIIGDPPANVPEPREKKFTIESADSFLPYVKDEDTLTIIKIAGQKVPKLSKDSIKDLDKITGLVINASSLAEIEPGAFNNVPKLSVVVLCNNELKEIKNGVFSGLPITYLRLDDNKIATIEDKAFTNMKLASIHLQNNKISTWNGGWFEGSPVTGVFIGNNAIQELPEKSFLFIKNYEPIYNIDADDDYDDKRKIVTIYFDYNQIKTIQPNAFEGVGNVEELNLQNNQIEQLPNDVFDGLTYISTLRLSNNKLSTIDEDILGDTQVLSAILEDNKFAEIPLDLLKSRKIFYVLMKNNPVKCSFIEKVEAWKSNVNGDYDRGQYEFPFGPEYENLKKNCVN